MIIENIDENNFEELLKSGTIILDFYANWCGPCKMLAPELEMFASNHSDVVIYKVDVDKYSEIARKYGVMTIPTLILYKNGVLIKKSVGYMPVDEIANWIGA